MVNQVHVQSELLNQLSRYHSSIQFYSVKAARFQKSSIPGHPLLDYLQRLLPGILLCIAITFAAMLLEAAETYLVGHTYLEALVVAILIGVAIRATWQPGPRFNPGIHVCAKFVLECAIVMLGASVSAAAIMALGPILIAGIVCIVAVAIGTSYCVCRLLGLPQRMAILIACGNSICGNSAIAAVAPVIGADGVVDLVHRRPWRCRRPYVAAARPRPASVVDAYGVLVGLTVYAVPQVLAATLPIGALSNQVGTVIKLVRVMMLGPVVLGFSLLAGGLRPTHCRPNRRGPRFREMIPWFITGFLALMLIRSLGLIPAAVVPPVTHAAASLTTIAMAGLGLGVDLHTVARTGLRVTLAVTVSLLVLGVISYALIRISGICGP
jgi:uncharacterized membrane protein YadS